MIKFSIPLLGIAFVILLTSSIQSISADHTEPGIGIFKDATHVNFVDTEGSKYQIYMHTIIRNVDEQLISVIESTANGAYIPHELTDHVFDTLMGQKEIVVIDNIKYEKIQYTYTPSLELRTVLLYPIFSEIDFRLDVSTEKMAKNKEHARWKIDYCAIFGGLHGTSCVPIFQVLVPNMTLEPDDTITQYWTILRQIS